MTIINELLKQKRYEELWQLCCGFTDLNLDDFMTIQKRLLTEQIQLLKNSQLGRKLMHGILPKNIDEFRAKVPLTTYSDYCPELLKKDESTLPAKPELWIQTSGRSGEYPCKWIPITHRFWEEAALNFAAIALFSSSSEKGEITFKKGFKLLHAAALPPFLTGNVARNLEQNVDFHFLPELAATETLSFEERVDKGLQLALEGGMDGFFGLAGILVAIAEKFSRGSKKLKLSKLVSQPKVAGRLAKAKIKSRMQNRKILPKDLWSLKFIVSMGTDSLIYQDKIKEMWGRSPLDVYGNSESTVIATQLWDYQDKVFFPNLNFLEFIPESEVEIWQNDKSYQPKTVLLNEVQVGENYELVITNFHGGALVRYRLGDIIKIKSLTDKKLGIKIPQMSFERRDDDLIDLGFMRLTERVIWQALENTGIPYHGWVARKEMGASPKLHLFVELDNFYVGSSRDLSHTIYEEIKKIDDGLYIYRDIESLEKIMDFNPIEVTLLHSGVFSSYHERMRATGADLAHLRPPHVNPSEKVLSLLGAIDDTEDSVSAGRN